jgi:Ser/Thr protein kinase RdoA (MazF antagonist)
MSVILFEKTEVYQELANSFEELKHLFTSRSWGDEQFYKALRRLYFANVATFLCQYHDNTPLSENELTALDPFQQLDGKRTLNRPIAESAYRFLAAWSSLKYNLCTNDGEKYQARESYAFVESLALRISQEVLEVLQNQV